MRSPLWNSSKASDGGAGSAARQSSSRHRTPGRRRAVAGDRDAAAPPARHEVALDPAAVVENRRKLAGAGGLAQPLGQGADRFTPASVVTVGLMSTASHSLSPGPSPRTAISVSPGCKSTVPASCQLEGPECLGAA